MPTMRFEHLVQVNDPLMPLLDTLTRAQVWRGLVLRVADPVQFLPGLLHCAIGKRAVNGDTITFDRTLDFGNFEVHDQVTLTTLEHIDVRAEAGDTFPASRLTMQIEEPNSDVLFVRFVYEMKGERRDDGLDAMTDGARRKAYELSDIDTIRRIRALAERGALD